MSEFSKYLKVEPIKVQFSLRGPSSIIQYVDGWTLWEAMMDAAVRAKSILLRLESSDDPSEDFLLERIIFQHGQTPPAIKIGRRSDTPPIPQGITLRDWFAGQALTGICANPGTQGELPVVAGLAAKAAYQVADAMLAARKGGAA